MVALPVLTAFAGAVSTGVPSGGASSVPKNMTAEQKERLHAYAESMNEAVSEPRSGIFGNKKKR